MTSISEKLKSQGVQVGKSGLIPKSKRRYPIETLLEGQFVETRYGETYVVESLFAHAHPHGDFNLTLDASFGMMAAWGRDERISKSEPQAFAFLDTETTGLATGSGTYAFLVGVGRFDADGFRLAQFFLRDPIEEPALLAALEEFLAPSETLVTFNGKAFDAPLLEARYITNGAPSPLNALAHLDILHLARRIWRERLPSRTLAYLEEHILGETRNQDDVPGWMIPSLYMDYIRSGDARPLKGVFYHNAMDILSMAVLTNLLAEMLTDPLDEGINHGQDLAALGFLYEDLGMGEKAAVIMQQALDRDLPDETHARTLKRLSILHKRRGEHSGAMSLWWQAAADRHIYAHEELAKHYEHREKDLQEARRWTQAGLAILNDADTARHIQVRWQSELDHRLSRLDRKLDKQNSS